MKGKGSTVLGVLLLVIGFILFGTLLTSIDSWAYAEASTTRTIITDGSLQGDVALGSPLFNENLDNVATITSTLVSDNPAPASYDSGNTTLTVSGLTDSSTRAMTVTYLTERTDSLLSTLQPIIPFFALLLFGGAGGGLILNGIRSR
jgi:hypothetical protein